MAGAGLASLIMSLSSSKSLPSLDRSPKSNWVEKAGGLPSDIEALAKKLHYEKGKPIGTAIAIAVGQARDWCASSKDPKVKERWCKAIAEWDRKRAGS